MMMTQLSDSLIFKRTLRKQLPARHRGKLQARFNEVDHEVQLCFVLKPISLSFLILINGIQFAQLGTARCA
jgi:hypothetical protein